MEDLYNNLQNLTSTLSQEYDPKTSYSPFRSDESYSPSRTISYDDPKGAAISDEYDPSYCEQSHDSYNEYNPVVWHDETNKTKRSRSPSSNSYEVSQKEYSEEYIHPWRNNMNYYEPKYNNNSHLEQTRKNSSSSNSYNEVSQKDTYHREYIDYSRSPSNSYKEHNQDMNYPVRGYKNSSKRSRSPSFKSSNFKNKRPARNESRHEFTAFVCNIAFTISEEELKEFFESKVKIQSFKLVDQKNEQGKLCKRFAFVSTFTETDFQTLLSFHDVKVDNRKLCIRKSDKKVK
jgi:hypothetical protein